MKSCQREIKNLNFSKLVFSISAFFRPLISALQHPVSSLRADFCLRIEVRERRTFVALLLFPIRKNQWDTSRERKHESIQDITNPF